MNTSLPRRRLLALLCGASALSPLLSRAAEATWTPTAAGTTYDWSLGDNWSSGIAPNGAGDIANLTNNIAGGQTVRLLTDTITLGTLNIGDSDSTHAFTISAGTGGFVFQGATAGVATAINANSTLQNIIIAPVSVGTDSPLTITNNNTGALTIIGVISGSSAITKEGARVVSLTGNNTFSGPLTISGGTINVGGGVASHIDSTNITVNGNATEGVSANSEGSLLQLGSNSAGVLESTATGGLINDAATVTLNGGALRFIGSTFVGTTQETFATLRANEGSSRLDVQSNAANRTTTLNLTSLERAAGATLHLRKSPVNPTRVVITNSSKAQLGMVGGDGASGTTTMNIIPGMIGGTNLSNDSIDLVTYNATDGLRALVAAEYFTGTVAASTNVNDNVKNGAIGITVDKAINALVYSSGGASNIGLGRTLTVTSGTIIMSNSAGSIGSGVNAGTLNFGAAEGIVFSNTLGTNAIGSVLAGTGGFTKAGTGTLTLSGANTYSGTTTVAAGVLRAGAANVLNSTALSLANTNGNSLNGGTTNVVTALDLNSFDQRVASLAGGGRFGGNIALGSAKLTVGVANALTSTTYAGVISGAGQVEKVDASRQILTGANLFSGGATVSGGELRLANLTGSATGSGALLINGTVAGTTVSGTGFATGATTVGDDGFIAAGLNSVTAGTARTNFGSAGTLGLGTTGGLTLNVAQFDFDLANVATVGGGVNDLITTGTLALGGASLVFNFNGLNGELATGTAYTLIDASLVTGFLAENISTTFLGAVAGEYTATYSVDNENLLVTFAATQVPEASTYALLFGAASLAFAGSRRSRKSS